MKKTGKKRGEERDEGSSTHLVPVRWIKIERNRWENHSWLGFLSSSSTSSSFPSFCSFKTFLFDETLTRLRGCAESQPQGVAGGEKIREMEKKKLIRKGENKRKGVVARSCT